jgi:hypothetical protein
MMLLLKCRKAQSLEKVEKLCRTANAEKVSNTRQQFASQFRYAKRCSAISLHMRMPRKLTRGKVVRIGPSGNGSGFV